MLFYNLPLTCDLDGPGLCHLGHWMRLIWLYLGDQYEVCGHGSNSIRGYGQLFSFFARLYEIWPRPVTWEDQGHRRLGHWMHLTRLYFGTNMKSVGEIAFEIWPIIRYLLILRTFDLDQKTLTFRSRSLAHNLVFECALFGCTLVPSMKSVGNRIQNKVASCLAFYPFWGNFDLDLWPWLYEGQGHRPLSHWMRLNRLYLGTKYEVCRWNSIGDIASSLVFYPFWGNLTLTFDLDQGHRQLSHWMRLIGLYLGTKYEVCRWNSLRDMTSSLVFYHFW